MIAERNVRCEYLTSELASFLICICIKWVRTTHEHYRFYFFKQLKIQIRNKTQMLHKCKVFFLEIIFLRLRIKRHCCSLGFLSVYVTKEKSCSQQHLKKKTILKKKDPQGCLTDFEKAKNAVV